MPTTYSECPSCHSLNKLDSGRALEKSPVCGKCGASLPLHGLASEITAAGLQKVLKSATTPVVVDFWAAWCGPCRAYATEYEKASRENPGAVFLKINTETEQQLSAQLGIRGIPCTIVYKDGREVGRQAGAMNADQVRTFIARA